MHTATLPADRPTERAPADCQQTPCDHRAEFTFQGRRYCGFDAARLVADAVCSLGDLVEIGAAS